MIWPYVMPCLLVVVVLLWLFDHADFEAVVASGLLATVGLLFFIWLELK